MKKIYLLKTIGLLCALVAGSVSGWAEEVTGTINFGSSSGSTNVNSASKTGNDSNGNTWTVTTVGTTSFTPNASYAQIGSGNKPATSITFTTTLSDNVNISSFKAKFGGFNGTAGTITLKVGDTTVGTGSLNASNDVTVSSNTSTVGKVLTVTVTGISKGVKAYNISYTYETIPSGPVAITDISLRETATVSIGSSITLTPTITPTYATEDIKWSSSNEAIAKVKDGVVTGIANGTTSITVSNSDGTKSASCTVTVVDANDGSKNKPFTVAEAIVYIDNGTDLEGKYVKGIITKIDQQIVNGHATYWLSDNGQTENQFEVYRGFSYNGNYFKTNNDIKVGDNVIVYGNLILYNNTIHEFASGSSIYSLNGVKNPELLFDESSYEVSYNGSLTITATADASGEITYSSSDATIAEINETTGVVTPHKEGIVTITATIAASTDNIAGSKKVTLTVTDERTPAGLSFSESLITKTWNESFTGQELTNTHNLSVNYSSSEPTVATVDVSTGTISILTAGTTIITATFTGNNEYRPATVSYTLTINKANASISYEVTQFDLLLNDDSFIAPTLQNPNNLTVTYASNNESIAIVDENTGEVVLDTGAEGSVTITASFEGNDYYDAGNASYTITISDPNKKGSKSNPYTVAEVINGTATGNGIYVKGFIVGEYIGKTTDPRTSGFTTDANIAIADEFSSSPKAGASIPVQLGNNDLKAVWGCQTTNGLLLGYEVIILGNKDTYFSVNGIKNTSEVTAISMPVTITDANYSTFSNGHATDFSKTGITVYKAKVDDNVVKLTEVSDGIVPANTGVILYNANSITKNVPFTTTSSTLNDNELVATVNRMLVKKQNGANFNYILQAGPVFNMATEAGAYMPAGKAYLSTTFDASESNARLSIVFAKDTEGIVQAFNAKKASSVVYDLQGRHVAKPIKGLYIVNGKKMVVK